MVVNILLNYEGWGVIFTILVLATYGVFCSWPLPLGVVGADPRLVPRSGPGVLVTIGVKLVLPTSACIEVSLKNKCIMLKYRLYFIVVSYN